MILVRTSLSTKKTNIGENNIIVKKNADKVTPRTNITTIMKEGRNMANVIPAKSEYLKVIGYRLIQIPLKYDYLFHYIVFYRIHSFVSFRKS